MKSLYKNNSTHQGRSLFTEVCLTWGVDILNGWVALRNLLNR